jgi:hypothetical protein
VTEIDLNALAAEAAESKPVPTQDQSKELVVLATELAGVESSIVDLEKKLEEAKARKKDITMRELPDLMAQYGQDKIGVPGLGVEFVLEPYYFANIKADWPPEQREKAFAYLESENAGDLIKAFVSAQFRKEDFPLARKLYEWLAAQEEFSGATLSLDKNVPWNTLTSWLREQIESGKVVPLETIGATVGQVVKLKKRKTK